MDEESPQTLDADDVLGKVLLAYQERAEAGETGRIGAAEETRLPAELQVRLDRAQRCIDVLLATKPPHAQFASVVGGTTNGAEFAAPESSSTTEALPRRLGRFEIRGELGRGGFGIVYLAWDPRIAREVALKIPRIEALASEELQSRFEHEAQAAARLDHPHIVPVLEAGVDGVMPYIASKYYRGLTLAHWLNRRANLIEPVQAALLVAQLAEAAEHAHRRGVLHRDIKPSNVLLAHEGEGAPQADFELEAAVPKLMDFGLAKLADNVRDVTRSGAMLGTVRYMAPEQAAGRTRAIGATADVYSLGAVLYELLTGAPPFSNDTDLEVLRRVMIDEPTRVRLRRPSAPRDLETICAKCLEKEPGRRYASAALLAKDLRHFLAGEPIQARRAGAGEVAWKWARRRPALASLIAVCVISLVAGTIGSLAFSIRMRADAQRLRKSEGQAQDLLYASDMQLAQQALNEFGTRQVVTNLERYVPTSGQEDRREFAWRFLHGMLNRNSGALPKHPGDVYGLAYSSDGKTLATICRDGQLRLWNLQDRSLIRAFANHTTEASSVTYSHDGQWIATGSDDGRVVIRPVAALDQAQVLVRPASVAADVEWNISGIAFGSDDRRIYAAAGHDLCCWSLPDGALVAYRQHVHEPYDVRAMSLASDGELLLTHRGEGRFWRAADLTPAPEEPFSGNDLRVAQFFGSQRQLILGNGQRLSIMNLQDRDQPVDVLSRFKSNVRSIDCSADGSVIVASSDDGVVQFNRLPKLSVVLRKHIGRVWAVKLAPDLKSFASAGADGQVFLWDVPSNIRFKEVEGAVILHGQHGTTKEGLAVSSDGRFVASVDQGGHIVLHDLHTDRRAQIDSEPVSGPCACFTADSRRLMCVSSAGQVKTWDVRTKRCLAESSLNQIVHGMDLAEAAGRLVVVTRSDHSATIYSWPECKRLFRLPGDEHVELAKFTPDGKKIIVGRSGSLCCFDASSHELLWRVAEQGSAYRDLAFLDDGATLLIAEFREGVALRDLKSGALITCLNTHPGPVRAVAASADGRTFASACQNNQLSIWDRKTLQPVLKFKDFGLPNHGGIRFSPSGDRLFVLDNYLFVELQAFDPEQPTPPKPDWIWPDELANGPQPLPD